MISAETIAYPQNISYAHVAAITLWVFEHLIITDLEVTYIWKSRWNVIKVLYIFVRYCTYIDVVLNTIVTINYSLRWSDSVTCKTQYQAIIWLMMIGIAVSDLIFNLRIWAVWRKTRTMAIILIALNIGFLTPVWVTWGLFANSLEFFTTEFLRGCIENLGTSLLPLAAWAVLLIYQTAILLLMLPAAFTAFKLGGRSNMTNIVIRDGNFPDNSIIYVLDLVGYTGIVYYIYLILVSLTNLVVISLEPALFSMLAIYARVAYAALSCRVVLHIREQAANDSQVHTVSGV
ncbi:hypothetical protein BDQ17DRAFT_814328 [Cyathus striatus]|nr:hypothetical protein BDQ17DRAFT_814328 [Cyathus striatus]